MLALALSKIVSPQGLLYALAAIILGAGIWAGVNFMHNYGAVQQANATLQQNIDTANQALAAQAKAAEQQKQIDQTTIDAVRQHDAAQTQALAQAQDNIQSLQALRKPTDADVKCSQSPYVATILNRLRRQHAPAQTPVGHPAGDAQPAH